MSWEHKVCLQTAINKDNNTFSGSQVWRIFFYTKDHHIKPCVVSSKTHLYTKTKTKQTHRNPKPRSKGQNIIKKTIIYTTIPLSQPFSNAVRPIRMRSPPRLLSVSQCVSNRLVGAKELQSLYHWNNIFKHRKKEKERQWLCKTKWMKPQSFRSGLDGVEHCAAFERELNVLLHQLPAPKLCTQFCVMFFRTPSFVTVLLRFIRTTWIFAIMWPQQEHLNTQP